MIPPAGVKRKAGIVSPQGNRFLFQQLCGLVRRSLHCRFAGADFSFFLPFPAISGHSGLAAGPGWSLERGRPAGMLGGLCLPNAIGIELILERWRQAWQGANDSKMQPQPATPALEDVIALRIFAGLLVFKVNLVSLLQIRWW